jgi:hypothetical protein
MDATEQLNNTFHANGGETMVWIDFPHQHSLLIPDRLRMGVPTGVSPILPTKLISISSEGIDIEQCGKTWNEHLIDEFKVRSRILKLGRMEWVHEANGHQNHHDDHAESQHPSGPLS